MNNIFISDEFDPYFNVAFEYQLLKTHKTGVWLYLWRNSPSIFIGRNQNLYAECNMHILKEKNILPVRRYSGGGCVYQDEGNLNFTFIFNQNELEIEEIKKYLLEVMHSLSIQCEFSGRNDLLIKDSKISGQAYYEEDGQIIYHGTILVNVDMDMLSLVLKPSKLKLASKGISSVRSRVSNIKEIYPEITIDDVQNACIQNFYQKFGESKTESIKKSLYPEVINKANELQTKTWLLKEAPNYDIIIEKKLSWGNVEVNMAVEDGKIVKAKIFTDSLLNLDLITMETKLIDMWMEPEEVFDVIEKNVILL